MKLYTYAAAPNPRRVHVFLAEKGIEIPIESVDLMKGEQFNEPLRSVTPLCTVPALVTAEGPVLTQVTAICDYLEALYPQQPLLGSTALEKGLIREWSHRIFLEGLMAVAEAFRNGNPAFADRALPGSAPFAQIPALVERGVQRLELFFRMLDEHLAGREYIVGDAFSMADIDAVVSCDFARWIRKSIPEDCVNLLRWHQIISARPSFKP